MYAFNKKLRYSCLCLAVDTGTGFRYCWLTGSHSLNINFLLLSASESYFDASRVEVVNEKKLTRFDISSGKPAFLSAKYFSRSLTAILPSMLALTLDSNIFCVASINFETFLNIWITLALCVSGILAYVISHGESSTAISSNKSNDDFVKTTGSYFLWITSLLNECPGRKKLGFE